MGRSYGTFGQRTQLYVHIIYVENVYHQVLVLKWSIFLDMMQRNSLETTLEDLGDNEKMKESGFIIPQTIPSHSWLKRGIDIPPNRYGIKPGRHWDGVDRSNGMLI